MRVHAHARVHTLNRRILILLNESHTAVAMAAAIATRLENHMPKDSTLVCTVTDNAANVVKMAAILHTDFDQVQIEAIERHRELSGKKPGISTIF